MVVCRRGGYSCSHKRFVLKAVCLSVNHCDCMMLWLYVYQMYALISVINGTYVCVRFSTVASTSAESQAELMDLYTSCWSKLLLFLNVWVTLLEHASKQYGLCPWSHWLWTVNSTNLLYLQHTVIALHLHLNLGHLEDAFIQSELQ